MNPVPTTHRTNSSYPFVPPRRHPNCLLLKVHLRNAPCRRLRREFFRRMHGEARRLGIVLSHKLGVCMLFGAERICTNAHRHQMVNWLIDQPEVATVDIGELAHLADIVQRRGRAARVDSAAPGSSSVPHTLVERVAGGAMVQWTQYVKGRLS